MTEISIKRDDIRNGNLVLVNAAHGLLGSMSEAEQNPIFTDQPIVKMQKEAAAALKKLLAAVDKYGKITGVSGYRGKEEQIRIYEDSLKENGREFTEIYVAYPDHSEHQTGLAVDLAQKQDHIDFICPQFPSDGIFAEFRRLAPLTGFIERYPEGKEKITGIGAEPWHFRYVGCPHAQIMTERTMVLEEYLEWIRQYDILKNPFHLYTGDKQILIGYIRFPEKEESICIKLPWEGEVSISGNNVDGVVITVTVLWQAESIFLCGNSGGKYAGAGKICAAKGRSNGIGA